MKLIFDEKEFEKIIIPYFIQEGEFPSNMDKNEIVRKIVEKWESHEGVSIIIKSRLESKINEVFDEQD